METVHPASPEALGSVADHIFGLLWGDDRARIPTVGDHAYQHIWMQLVSGARRPGEHLSDVEIASSLGVSRTPVREALRRLVQEELVRADPRRGFWVREFTARDIQEFYDVRIALESLALQQGGACIPEANLHDQLARVISLRQRLARNPVLDFLRHDFQFHNLVINASGNGRLVRILATLRAQVSIFQIRDTGFPLRLADALAGHERVVRALLDGDVTLAATLLGDHIADSRDAVLSDLFPTGDGAVEHRRGPRDDVLVHSPPHAGQGARGQPGIPESTTVRQAPRRLEQTR